MEQEAVVIQLETSAVKSCKKHLRKGFSILEVAIVLLLVTILFSFALPQFNRFLSSSLESETRNTLALMQDIRFTSILDGSRHKVSFYLKDKSYQVFQQERTGWKPFSKQPDRIKFAKQVKTIQFVLDNKDYSDLEKVDVYFHPSGLIDPFSITFEGSDKETLGFSMHSLSGSGKIHEKQEE